MSIQSNQFKAGRIYSVIFADAVKMVGKRDVSSIPAELLAQCPKLNVVNGKAINPLADTPVHVRRVSSVTAAGGQTWENFKARNGRVDNPDNDRKPWYVESDENNCIVVGVSENTKGRKYLRGLPQGVTSEAYFVDTIPATDDEVSIIRAFKKSTSEAEFVTLPLDALQNVVDVTA